jgi:hypothetical protein
LAGLEIHGRERRQWASKANFISFEVLPFGWLITIIEFQSDSKFILLSCTKKKRTDRDPIGIRKLAFILLEVLLKLGCIARADDTLTGKIARGRYREIHDQLVRASPRIARGI